MTQFKKCEVPGCGTVLNKHNSATFYGIHPRHMDLGGRAERDREWTKQKQLTGLEPFVRISRKEKYNVCKKCFKTLSAHEGSRPSKFELLDKNDKWYEDSTTNLFNEFKSVKIVKNPKQIDSTFLDGT